MSDSGMKIVVGCCEPAADQLALDRLLLGAGVAASLPAQNAKALTIGEWHDHLLAKLGKRQLKTISAPGKAWEQALAEIFIANWKQEIWGWTEPRSTWVLDFLANYDGHFCFVLAYESPYRVISRAFETGQVAEIDQLLRSWQLYNSELLYFYNRNRERCLLVDLEVAVADPAKFAQACKTHLDLPMQVAPPVPAGAPIRQVIRHFGSILLTSYPDVVDLYQEIVVSASILETTLAVGNENDGECVEIADVVAEYAHLLQANKKQFALIESLASELRGTVADLTQEIELHKAKAAAVVRQLDDCSTAYLHQLDEQEALHSAHLAEIHAECASQIQRLDILHAAQLANARAAYATELTELHHGHTSKLHESQASYEVQLVDLATDWTNRLSSSEQYHARQLDGALHGLRVQHEEELDVGARERARLLEELTWEQENVCGVLLALSTAQDEAQEYFSRLKREESERNMLEGRWERLLNKIPDYLDWESASIAVGSEGESISWRFEGISFGNKKRIGLQVEVALKSNTEVLIVRTRDEAESMQMLMHWPATPEQLASLSTSDWRMTLSLCRSLITLLSNDSSIANSNRISWTSIIQNIILKMAAVTPTLRYDCIQLRQEQVNHDYEHLWLTLENLSLGDKIWPRFEFRIGAGAVRRDVFTNHPRLEFPAPDAKTQSLENWVAESKDNYGEKAELRFEISSEAVDLGVWATFSKRDQAFLMALLNRLPDILARLARQQPQIARSWSDWQHLVDCMRKILQLRLSSDLALTGGFNTVIERQFGIRPPGNLMPGNQTMTV